MGTRYSISHLGHRIGLLAGVCLAGLWAGCSPAPPPPDDAVARFSGGYVTTTEVERQLDSAPRRLPPDQNPREWLARRIAWRKLLVEKWRSEIESSPRWGLSLHGAECRFVVGELMEALAGSVDIPSTVVDEELERQRQLASNREEILRVRHIFRRVDASTSESDRAAQQALARRLLDRLRQGESFEELAREYSESETAARGGLLDGLRRGVVDEDFERAAFALERGEISEVVTTRHGYHIVRLEERFTPPPFVDEQVRPLIVTQLRHAALQRQRAELVSELRSSETYVAGWDAAGQLQPDENGVVLEVGDVAITLDDLEGMDQSTPALGGGARTPAQTLSDLLDAELLCQEALATGVVGEVELAHERDQLEDEVLQRTAEKHELYQLRTSISEEELERFVVEFPRRVAVPGQVRVHVVAMGYSEPQAYDIYGRAREIVNQVRQGADMSLLARRLEEVLDIEMAEDISLMSQRRLVEYGPEVARAISSLEPGEVTDVVRLGPNTTPLIVGAHDGAIVIAELLEREPERPLDLATEGDELRSRYWKRFGSTIIGQREEQALTAAGFQLLEAP